MSIWIGRVSSHLGQKELYFLTNLPPSSFSLALIAVAPLLILQLVQALPNQALGGSPPLPQAIHVCLLQLASVQTLATLEDMIRS